MARTTGVSLTGLSSAEVSQRVADGRTNTVGRSTGRSVWQIIRANVFTRVNAILGVLCVIVLSTGSWINAAFGLLIIANSAVGVIQELRAKRTLANLRIVGETQPTVLRDGERRTVHQSEVVVDDLIVLKSGDEIVVDGTLVVVADSGFAVDESQLTGEADAVHKNAGDEVLSGSFVTGGTAVFRAEKVGEEAYAARLAAEASEFSLTDSVLMSGINSILRVITWLLIPTGVLTIWTQLVRSGTDVRESILSMAAAIVPMVPEGLVLMTSIAFAAGVIRLGQYKALVNELVAIEGLARVNTVCTDKTGTLTTNEMELDGTYSADGAPAPDEFREALGRLVASQEDRNSTAEAILAAYDAPDPFDGAEIPFNSKWKYSGVQCSGHAWILGAPDVLLSEGPAATTAQEFGDRGLRVLAFGRVEGTLQSPDGGSGMAEAPSIDEPVLVTLGQQLRPDARETLDFFDTQDVDLKIISGDNPDSVAAVARGATDRELVAVDARTLDDLSETDFDAEVARANVFGRVRPEQKQQMVESLHRAGRTVAMTGDGVNDVLALKKADIGVAMGAGAPATRSVAQLVLLTNRFSALPRVVGEGRRVIGNIERVANLFLTKTVYSVVLALVVAVMGISFPFQPIHVTITGWFTIGIPAFILALAPNNERPRDGFLRRVLSLAVPSGVLVGGFAVAMWIAVYPGGDAPEIERAEAGTAVLLALIVMGLWVLGIVARPLVWWKILLLVGCVVGYVLLFTVPFLRELVLLEPGNTQLMCLGLVVGAVGALVIEVVHRVVKGRRIRK
ncbi:Putative cation-transporting ATPase E [Corynebacterium glyciniphilum AJ 3170]|uniref:Putative cation-transporting ATPase E n=1 Tax=Corynebacterium glyciniphilum AJ 3170 TaxID=1404245 RepID=X5DWJ5_9CORY|nr:HAD-IC family P-type ATPase [Corynebacterium glyciniphilum]AHW64987.1 Putative cation-transporting ATPase E [Corynebacterium glyciniphilum AJ 3170]